MCLHLCVCQAIEWQAARKPSEVMEEREAMITQLELAGNKMEQSGEVCVCYEHGLLSLKYVFGLTMGMRANWFDGATKSPRR